MIMIAERNARTQAMANRHVALGVNHKRDYSDEFYTPDHIVRALGSFDLDPCAGPKSHATRNIRHPKCGLRARWKGRVWMNPPYLHIHAWLHKFATHGDGICLVNARPETVWFQTLAASCDALLWLRGRIQFERPGLPHGHGPVGSVLVAMGRRNAIALKKCGLAGILTLNPSVSSV